MPQPIRGRLTNLHFENDAIKTREKLTACLAAVINEWSRTEGTLGILLAGILHIRYSVATAILGSIVNFTARLDLVNAAAKATLNEEQITKTIELMQTVKRRAGERNNIVHGVWSISDEYPESLILCDAQVAFGIVNKQYEAGMNAKSVVTALKPHLRKWDEHDFIVLQKRFFDIQTAVIAFSNSIAQGV